MHDARQANAKEQLVTLSAEIANIERRLGGQGVTVKRLCDAAGIDQSTWSRWKAGSTNPNMATWMRVLSAVNEIGASGSPAEITSFNAPETDGAESVCQPEQTANVRGQA